SRPSWSIQDGRSGASGPARAAWTLDASRPLRRERSPMDFRLSPTEARFQREVHAWLVANLPAGWGTPDYRKPEEPAEKVRFARRWQGKLHEGGWSGLHWPREYGGRCATPTESSLFPEGYTCGASARNL